MQIATGVSFARSIQTAIMPRANFQDGQDCSILVVSLLDCGFLVCGPNYIVMQFDSVYVRRLVVMLVVHTLHAPLPAR